MKLTNSQLEAIETIDNNLQIIACAGSGKTETISRRIVNIVEKKGVSPSSIVAFTFTEKAAAELKHRVLNRFKEKFDNINGLAEMYIGTTHGWCLQFLQDNLPGYQKYSVLTDVKQKLMIDRAPRKTGLSDLGMKRFTDTHLYITWLNILRESELESGDGKIPDKYQEIISKYEQYLREHGYLDYTMLLTHFLKNLQENHAFKQKVTEKIKYLIVDEYQDVNHVQEMIVRELSKLGANICVVGDDDQTIYQWRGSDIHNILNFEKNYTNVKQVVLEENFRSSDAIVTTAKGVIENNNPERLQKSMKAAGHQAYEQGDIILNMYDEQDKELDFIVNTIKNTRGIAFTDKADEEARGLDYSDMCILLRKWKKAELLVQKLTEAEIPFIVTGVTQLMKQPEVIASQGIFEYLQGAIDEDELTRRWTELSEKIDKKDLKKAIEGLNKIKKRLRDANTYEEDKKIIFWYEEFILQQIFEDFRKNADITEGKFDGLHESKQYDKSEIIFYNLGMFSQIIDDFESVHFKSDPSQKLNDFMGFLEYSANDYYPEGWLNQSYRNVNAVVIMTVYQAKGLEFPVVFVPFMNKNYFPAQKIGGTKVWKFMTDDLIANREKYDGGAIVDERRIFYVAMTRSKKFLFVSRAPGTTRNEKTPSDFLTEMRQTGAQVVSSERNFSDRKKIEPRSKEELSHIVLNFSLLQSYFECPYSFKYYTLYGFRKPLNPRMGYGKSIHDALMEIHKKAIDGEIVETLSMESLEENHFHFPYAIDKVKKELSEKAKNSINDYFGKHKQELKNIEYAEQGIELDFGNGIIVNGRIDMVKKRDVSGEEKIYIVDFKTSLNNKDYEISSINRNQLLLYGLGYKDLTGRKADFVQIYNLNKNEEHNRELLDIDLAAIKKDITQAADEIRNNSLNKKCSTPGCVCGYGK